MVLGCVRTLFLAEAEADEHDQRRVQNTGHVPQQSREDIRCKTRTFGESAIMELNSTPSMLLICIVSGVGGEGETVEGHGR